MLPFALVTVDRRTHTVRVTGVDEWAVSSASVEGVWHTVRRWGHVSDHYACSCRDPYGGRAPTNRTVPCRHARAVVTARPLLEAAA